MDSIIDFRKLIIKGTDCIIAIAMASCVDCITNTTKNYIKRREVDFGICDSIVGAVNETKERYISIWNGEEPKEYIKGIEKIK